MQPQRGTAQFVRKKPALRKEFKPVSLEVSFVLLGEHRSHHCWRNLAGQPWHGEEWLPPSVGCTSLFMTGQPMRMKHFYVFLSEGQENQCKSFLTIQEQGGTTSLYFVTHPFFGIIFQLRFRQLKSNFFQEVYYSLIRNHAIFFFFFFLFIYLCLKFYGGVMYCIPGNPSIRESLLCWEGFKS